MLQYDGFILESKADITIYTIPQFTATGLVAHGFTTRHGGSSTGHYHSLNLGLHVGDHRQAVLANRRLVCRSLGMDFAKLVAGQQVHGDKVAVVTANQVGRGNQSMADALPGVDALITNLPGVPLASYYADCVPLFLLDPVKKVVALAHAGWRGTVSKIGAKTIGKMNSHFACLPEDILAAVGPAIGPCCYLVDQRVVEKLTVFNRWHSLVCAQHQGQWLLDLWATNKQVLLEAGIKEHNITVAEICSACNNDLLFSHRADGGHTGRMASLIMLH